MVRRLNLTARQPLAAFSRFLNLPVQTNIVAPSTIFHKGVNWETFWSSPLPPVQKKD